MQYMRLESEKYPPLMVDMSTLMMSPPFSTTFSSGKPWQTTSLMEVHTLNGYPSKMRSAETASWAERYSSTQRLMSMVVVPAQMCSPT